MIKGDAIWERLKERNESKVNKSVYSLVLADDVVEAIDRMAYSMNTSRSNLINQILAERVQLLTPEKRMREIFAKIEQLMDSRFQPLRAQPPSLTLFKTLLVPATILSLPRRSMAEPIICWIIPYRLTA